MPKTQRSCPVRSSKSVRMCDWKLVGACDELTTFWTVQLFELEAIRKDSFIRTIHRATSTDNEKKTTTHSNYIYIKIKCRFVWLYICLMSVGNVNDWAIAIENSFMYVKYICIRINIMFSLKALCTRLNV